LAEFSGEPHLGGSSPEELCKLGYFVSKSGVWWQNDYECGCWGKESSVRASYWGAFA